MCARENANERQVYEVFLILSAVFRIFVLYNKGEQENYPGTKFLSSPKKIKISHK